MLTNKPPPVLGLPSLGHPLHPAARAARTSPRLGADALSERDGALPKGAGRQSTRGDRNGAGHTSLLTSVSVIPAGCGTTFVSLFGTKEFNKQTLQHSLSKDLWPLALVHGRGVPFLPCPSFGSMCSFFLNFTKVYL